MRTIYLDYNSTTPLAGAARQAMLPFLEDFFAASGNPHWQSRAVEEAIEDARSSVATMLGCNTSEVFFTSGGTESINLALLGAARAFELARSRKTKGHLIISGLEHPPVSAVAEHLQSRGWELSRLASNPDGSVEAETLSAAIRKNTALISIQTANSQTGTLQNISELSKLPRPNHCIFHTDATQALGKIEIDVNDLGVDLLSVSAHNMYGPKGVGALFGRSGVAISPQMFGGRQEGGLRPGTASPMLLAGFGAAAQLVKAGGSESAERLQELRDRFIDRFLESAVEGYQILSSVAEETCLPNTICIRFPKCHALRMVEIATELHVGLPSAHELTSSIDYEHSPFAALGLPLDARREIVTISVGWNTTIEEAESAAERLAELYHRTRDA